MPIDKLIGVIFSFIPALLIVFLLLKKKEPFFNFREIISEHLSVFKECKSQYFVFYVLPLFLSVGLTLLFDVNTNFFTHLGVVLSIILSILMAVLAMLCDFDYSKFKDENQKSKCKISVKQTINAILFCCIIGISLLLLGFVVIAASENNINWITIDMTVCKKVLSVVTYYLLIVVLLNLLLVMKNISNIINAVREVN